MGRRTGAVQLSGQVVLKLRTPWRDGTMHVVMSPLECMQSLATLVPQPSACPWVVPKMSRTSDSFAATNSGD